MASDPMPHRSYPCDECPVRADNADNPRSKFPAERWETLLATVDDGTGGSAPLGAPLFGCHKGEPGTGEDLACAGWLAQFGDRSVTVRLAIFQGRLNSAALQPGPNWPPLHDTWEAMAEAHLWRPGDPDEHLPTHLVRDPEGGLVMLAVKLSTGSGPVWYGPFRSGDEAERFAAFLTRWVDTATAEDVPFPTPMRSPVTALLDHLDRLHGLAAYRVITDLTRETTPAATDTPATADQTKGTQ